MECKITVFTPTYNRANLIGRVYESLLKQTNKGFKWLVIDDGSTDNTREVIDSYISEGKMDITYVYKENGGLASGYNTAIDRLDTELSVCIDSDDWMPENAIEKILSMWEKYGNSNVAGLIGLDVTPEGRLIGDHLKTGDVISPIDLLASKTNRGDKKYVIRTDCYKNVAPIPVFSGEKDINPHYLVLKLCIDYYFVGIDEYFCIVDYQDTGMTANQLNQYVNSPNGYAELRRVILAHKSIPIKYLIKTVIHYCSSCQIAGKKSYVKKSPKPVLTFLCIPLGYLLTVYIRIKTRVN